MGPSKLRPSASRGIYMGATKGLWRLPRGFGGLGFRKARCVSARWSPDYRTPRPPNYYSQGFEGFQLKWPCGINARQEKSWARWSQTDRAMHHHPCTTLRVLAALHNRLSTRTEMHQKYFVFAAGQDLGRRAH